MAVNEAIELENESTEEIAEPPLYKVFLHNDEVTTQNFVADILERIFNKTPADAWELMLQVHTNGIGLCGIYTREIAEAKVGLVRHEASAAGFPLKCTMEEQ